MRNKILIVDDVDINREILRSILEDEYTILEAENGKQALEIVDQEAKDMAAIMLDLVMPEMDGTQVLEELNRREVIGKVPVLVISGDHTVEVQKKCFELGISDFIAKPFNNAIIKQRVKNTAEFFDYKLKLEDKVAEQTNVLRKAYRTLQIQAEYLQKKNQQIIEMLGTVVEYRSTESGEHIQRVKGYTRILAEAVMEDYPEYELTKEKIDIIESVSALHDIGKIAIPDRILLKPGRLTAEEFEYMKSHTIRGCELLDSIKEDWNDDTMKYAYEICRHHHERYDGRGYPSQLVGDDIPYVARIAAVADTFDAMTSKRSYRDSLPIDVVRAEIERCSGTQFDPNIAKVFLDIMNNDFDLIREIQEKYK
jgi:putative two-component system response regulator